MAADTAQLLEEDGERGGDDRRLARFLIGGSVLRRRRCLLYTSDAADE